MNLYHFLSLLRYIRHLIISLFLCSAIRLHMLVRYVTPCFCLTFLPSLCPVSIRFSKSSSLIMCSKHLNYIFPNLNKSVHFLPIFLKTSWWPTCSICDIRSIMLKYYIRIDLSNKIQSNVNIQKLALLIISVNIYISLCFLCICVRHVFALCLFLRSDHCSTQFLLSTYIFHYLRGFVILLCWIIPFILPQSLPCFFTFWGTIFFLFKYFSWY